MEGIDQRTDDVETFIDSRTFAESIFGDLSGVEQSDKNPVWLARKLAEEQAPLPDIYMACGLEDFLLEKNRKLKDDLLGIGCQVTYEEGPGGHEWDFWNRYILKVLEWLPLETQTQAGVGSGNIGK